VTKATSAANQPAMTHLVRLDLERVRVNLELTTGTPQTEQDVLRLLAALKVRQRNGDWFTADDAALRQFLDGEVLESGSRDNVNRGRRGGDQCGRYGRGHVAEHRGLRQEHPVNVKAWGADAAPAPGAP
jgi:hypothetical protein